MADKHDHDVEAEQELGEEGLDEAEGEEFDEEEEDSVVVLEDAEGNVSEYLFIDVIELEGDSFALLTPLDEDEGSESTEIFIMRYDIDEDGGETFGDLDDEELFKRVQELAEKRFAEWQEAEEE